MGMHGEAIPSRIVAILEMEQGWMNVYALIADLEFRWGNVELSTVRRAVHRLVEKELVLSRLTETSSMRSGSYNHNELEVRAA